jgi:hypothetical protein
MNTNCLIIAGIIKWLYRAKDSEIRKLDIPVNGALSSSKTSASQYGTLYDY